MKISDQLESIRGVLDAWAKNESGGKAFVASDPSHMWEMAYAASDKLRVIICFMGEEARGDNKYAARTHRVDRRFNVVVTRGRGFNADRGESLTVAIGNARPLFDLFEECRDLVRAIVNISAELPVDYTGAREFQMGEIIMDAYVIDFLTAVDLPYFADQPDNPAPPIGT